MSDVGHRVWFGFSSVVWEQLLPDRLFSHASDPDKVWHPTVREMSKVTRLTWTIDMSPCLRSFINANGCAQRCIIWLISSWQKQNASDSREAYKSIASLKYLCETGMYAQLYTKSTEEKYFFFSRNFACFKNHYPEYISQNSLSSVRPAALSITCFACLYPQCKHLLNLFVLCSAFVRVTWASHTILPHGGDKYNVV